MSVSVSPFGKSGSRKFVADLSSFSAFFSTFFFQLKVLGALPVTITTIPIIPSNPTKAKPANDNSTMLIRNESSRVSHRTKFHLSTGTSSSNRGPEKELQ